MEASTPCPGKAQAYEAAIGGDYGSGAHPTDTTLVLKSGAKVMMLRNDSEGRWVNGTVARVSRLDDKRVWVEVEGKEHEVEPASWESRGAMPTIRCSRRSSRRSPAPSSSSPCAMRGR